MKLLSTLCELLYPRGIACAICGDDIDLKEDCVCAKCKANLPKTPPPRYGIAGITAVIAAYEYEEPIRQAIINYKYNFKRQSARFFAHALSALEYPVDNVLVEVPLHKKRLRERKFCQTAELCRELCQITGANYQEGALVRVRDTPKQSLLSGDERDANVHGAFKATRSFEGLTAVLVDDVASTGATLRECAAALKKAGAAEVWAIVIAM